MEYLLKFLRGSRNYGLHDSNSDYDYIIFTVPKFRDIYLEDCQSESFTSEKFDYIKHDIRKLPELIRKSNPAYLELLYSSNEDRAGGPQVWDLLSHLIREREHLLLHNPMRLYKATLGTMNQKLKEMERLSPSRAESIAQHGYDLKSFHHLARLRHLIFTCAEMLEGRAPMDTNPFWFEESLLQQKMMQYKTSPTPNYQQLSVEWIKDVESLAHIFRAAPPLLSKGEQALLTMEKIIYQHVANAVLSELKTKNFIY